MEQIISSLLELYKTNPQTFIFLEYSILFLSQQAFSNYNKYKLIKNNKIQNCKVIHEAPNIKEIKQRRNSISEREKIEDNIKNFVNVISQHISKEDMQAINQNLQHLGYHSDILQSVFLSFMGYGGVYKSQNHKIYANIIYDNNKKASFNSILYHELLHSVTSAHIPSKKFEACGFCQNNLGRSINEGYTELLNQRYFKSKLESGYKYDIAVAEMVEFIIGKSKMTDLYFHIDLKGLISELSRYQSEDKVKQFILDLDTIHELKFHKYKYTTILQNNGLVLANRYNRINKFLYNAFLNKSEKIFNKDDKAYLQESKRFLELFSKIEQTTKLKKRKTNIVHQSIPQLNPIYQPVSQVNKPKRLAKIKGAPNNHTNGFIDIIAMIALLTFIITIAVVIANLLLQTR